MTDEERFPVVRAADLASDETEARWLIDELWTASAVGLIGGQPKSFKTWIALEMAVCVASGKPCLGQYRITDPGRALVYLAEDSLPAVRERIAALAAQHQIDLATLDVHVITAPTMRIDLARDQVRLQKTVRHYRPRLLVLDPLVRIHRLDENSSVEVSGFLAYLRELQRELDVAIVLVHHTRKNTAPSHAAGQGLRGSGDFHAWSDSGLYLKRTRSGDVIVTVEHRSAPAPKPIAFRLDCEPRPHLRITQQASGPSPEAARSLEERVIHALQHSGKITRAKLRQQLSVKNERLGHALDRLRTDQRVHHGPDGWSLTDSVPRSPPQEMKGTERSRQPG